jgi:2-polyprenyl-6-methoxyphenol hydroxylase-like FAD-dependent oxidoreductase
MANTGGVVMKTDVLIAGAGPVGLTLAAELARYGLAVRIVDKAPLRTDKSKAIVLWSRTLELLERQGCAPEFVAAGLKVRAANIIAGDRQIARIDLTEVHTPYPFALMLPQSDTERLLEAQATARGATLQRGVELTSFSSSAGAVTSILRHPDGRQESLEASWLVGCDGAHSTVRHQLGAEFRGDALPTDFILADLTLHGVPHHDELSIMLHSDGILAIFPIGPDRYRVIADVGPAGSSERRADPTLEEVQAILTRRGPGGITADAPRWLASFRINERKVAEYRSGRVFLAGDAAHVHSPAGGQGMNTGMQDACNLAWKLALVARGRCGDALLDSYSRERSAVGDDVLKNAGRLTTLAMIKGGVKQSIRNHIATLLFGLAPLRRKLADTLAEVSIGYPESPLSVQEHAVEGGPHAGERAPLRPPGAGEAPVGAGDAPRFALFGEPEAATSALLARHPDLVEPELRAPFAPGGLWLVRPDGYIAVATRRGDGQRVAQFLDRLATP